MTVIRKAPIHLRHVRVLLAVLCLSLFAAGCGGDGDNASGGAGDNASGEASQGVTDTEVKVGFSYPLSGPVAVTGRWGTGMRAAFEGINRRGGVNGREVTSAVLDDAYDPSRLVANWRRLNEQDEVFALVGFGVITNAAIPYINDNAIPTVVYGGTTDEWSPENTPFGRAVGSELALEAGILANWVLEDNPNARIGMVNLGNDAGKVWEKGFRDVLEENGKPDQLVAVEEFEPTATDLTGNFSRLRNASVDAIGMVTAGPSAAEMIAFGRQTGWKGAFYHNSSGTSRPFMEAAGDAGVGLRVAQYLADAADLPDADWVEQYEADIAAVGEGLQASDQIVLDGWAHGQAFLAVLGRAGDDLTRQGFMEAWDSMEDVEIGGFLPGITLNSGPDGLLVHSYYRGEWNGSSWDFSDELYQGEWNGSSWDYSEGR